MIQKKESNVCLNMTRSDENYVFNMFLCFLFFFLKMEIVS